MVSVASGRSASDELRELQLEGPDHAHPAVGVEKLVTRQNVLRVAIAVGPLIELLQNPRSLACR